MRYLDNSAIAEKIHISKGTMLNTVSVFKFGAVGEMSTATTGTVWDIDDTLYPWSAWDSDAGVVTLDRANVGDADKVVNIIGLDANYDSLSESVALTAASGNTTTNSFARIFRAYVIGTDAENIGDVTINKSATAVAKIGEGQGQTLMSVYTVPRGFTAYLIKRTVSAESSADATFNMSVRVGGEGAFRIRDTGEVSGSSVNTYEWSSPVTFPEKSDIDCRVTTRSNNGRYTYAFELILTRD